LSLKVQSTTLTIKDIAASVKKMQNDDKKSMESDKQEPPELQQTRMTIIYTA